MASVAPTALDFEPYSARHWQDPYPIYQRLRDEAPLYHAPVSNLWCLSRHEDVAFAFRHPELFSSHIDRRNRPGGFDTLSPLKRVQMLWRVARNFRSLPFRGEQMRFLINSDGEDHSRLRAMVNRGFTPRRIQAWQGRIREIVDGCMDQIGEQKSFDVVEELAIPLPVTVIAEMLGVEAERRHDFKRWSDLIIQGGTGSGAQAGSPRMLDALGELNRYVRPLVRERREHPKDDLLSVLVAAEGDAVGLDDMEVFLFVMLLLIAGNETTTNLLSNTVDALLKHPEQLAPVASDPARIPGLIEEVLRWDSPVQLIQRTATQDVEIAGGRIPKGAITGLLLGAANRDERAFPDPDRFLPDRDTTGHLAFGLGVHFCLGASLARLEARGALEALLPRLPDLQRVRPEVELLDSYVVRGRARLELAAA